MFTRLNRQIKRMVIRQQRSRPIVRISDTTLRDGAQTPGIRLDAEQKLRIAAALAEAGVHSIDCGFPAAGPLEREGIRRIASRVRGPILSCLVRTRADDIDMAAEDLAAVSPFRRAVTLFLGVSPIHREHKLGLSKAQVIETIVRAIEHAARHFELISFGPEDASRTEPDFLCEVYEKAIEAGAISVGFTDTVGVLTPDKAADRIRLIQDRVPNIDDALIAVHFHNDLGLATANALACVKQGVHIVQGTINGIGERAGNTAIEEVVVALALHADEFGRTVKFDPAALHSLSQLVSELTGFVPPPNKAVVGPNIFRTETGIHQDGLLKHPDTYLPFRPELIGAGPVELLLGRNSGRSAVRHHLQAAGIEPSDEHVRLVLEYIKTGHYDAEEQAEIRGFLERLRPYVGEDAIIEQALCDDADVRPKMHAPQGGLGTAALRSPENSD